MDNGISNRKFLYGIVAVEILLIGIVLGWYVHKKSAYEDGVLERQYTISELNQQLADLTNHKGQPVLDAESVKLSLSSAKEAGEDIADKQNQLLELHYKERKTREEEEADYDAMRDLQTDLVAYFGSESPFRTAWYLGDTSFVTNAAWQFQTNYDYVGDSVPVLWVLANTDQAKDEDNSIIAYVTGEYHAKDRTFDHLVKHITRIGNAMYSFTNDQELDLESGSDVSDTVNSVLDLTDIDRHVTKEQHEKEEAYLDDGDMQDFREMRSEIRDKMMQDYE